MSSNRKIRRDDFDIESIDRIHERDRKSRTSGSRTRSRSRKRSYSRRLDDGSRSRSRSGERRRRRRVRDSYSSSRSRSRSRSYRRSLSKRSDRRHTSRKYRDSRSRSNSRSRSRSKSYSRHRRGRYRYDYDDVDKYKKNSRSRSQSRLRSHTRSRSRSSSHFGDYKNQDTKKQNDTPSKPLNTSLTKIQDENSTSKDSHDNLEDLPLPQQKPKEKKSNTPYQFNDDEPIDRARIHREIEEKLRAELAKEGKVYPPPKPEASHPVFANDGSFLEIFKKMQQAQASPSTSAAAAAAKPIIPVVPAIVATAHPSTAPYLAAAATGKSAPPPPLVGRRRGGKILKTGVVAKPKIQTDANTDPKDFWALYLAEVNKYKNTACESEQGNRPLVK